MDFELRTWILILSYQIRLAPPENIGGLELFFFESILPNSTTLESYSSQALPRAVSGMARRRVKKRTHAGAQNSQNAAVTGRRSERSPKSMVIRIGAAEVGQSVSQLVRDVRLILEPGTASRLKERKSNRLKDFLVMAGPLGVTHLLLFSRSASGNTNLRLAVTPRGPTLHFRVENYSLCKDILRAQRHPKASTSLHLNPPLVCLYIRILKQISNRMYSWS